MLLGKFDSPALFVSQEHVETLEFRTHVIARVLADTPVDSPAFRDNFLFLKQTYEFLDEIRGLLHKKQQAAIKET